MLITLLGLKGLKKLFSHHSAFIRDLPVECPVFYRYSSYKVPVCFKNFKTIDVQYTHECLLSSVRLQHSQNNSFKKLRFWS